jgi:hypothetical protein
MTSSVVTNQNGTITSQTVVVGGKGARSSKTRPKVAPPPRRLPIPTGSDAMQVAAGVAAAVAGALSTAANLLALCWFGMWMGMTSRSANLATLKTLLLVQIIPWFVIMFGAGIGATALMSGMLFRRSVNPLASFAWWPILSAFLMAVVVVAKDVIFVVWSRNKLHASFRDEAARSLGQPRLVTLPRLPAMAAPPVIAAPR